MTRAGLTVDPGARLIASELLVAAGAAAEHLDESASEEAVHDFRVAVRRLRTWLRAFKRELAPAVTRRTRRALRSIVRTTNLGRDSAVQLEWLRDRRHRFTIAERDGVEWLTAQLERKRARTSRTGGRAPERFRKLAARIGTALARYQTRGAKHTGSFGAALGKRITRQAAALTKSVRDIESADDATGAHAARIAAKRLRYVVEPAVQYSHHGKALLNDLRALQDDLGTLHDAHVFQRSHLVSHGSRAGVVGVRRRLESEVERLYRRMETRWTRTRMKKIEHSAARLAKRLEAMG
jgi:CHAD domain-containing protein